MNFYLSISLIFILVFFSSGCTLQNPAVIEKNTTKIVEDLNKSQSYYDTLVQSEPMNATAWVLALFAVATYTITEGDTRVLRDSPD